MVGPIPRIERSTHRWRGAAFVLLFYRVEDSPGDGTHRLGAGPDFRVETVTFGPPRQLICSGLFGVSEWNLVVAQLGEVPPPVRPLGVEILGDAAVEFLLERDEKPLRVA